MYARALDRYCQVPTKKPASFALAFGEVRGTSAADLALEGRCDADMDDKEKHGEMQSH